MLNNTSYCYKDSSNFVIENGIIKGIEEYSEPEHNNYGQLILERLRDNPQFIGQIDGITGRKETLEEMAEKSVKCALWLIEENIQPGDIIGICTHNHVDAYVPFFASLYVGAVFNPWWDSGVTKDMVKHFLSLTRPKILFIHEASLDITLEVAAEMEINKMKIVTFDSLTGYDLHSLDEIISFPWDNKSVSEFRCTKLSRIDDPAFVVYTSGSTGKPKGIVTSHKSIFGNSPNFIKLGKSKENVISIGFSSLSWGVGIACLLRAAVVPETRVIFAEFHSETTGRLIEKFKINLMHLSPRKAFKLQKSEAVKKYDLSSLKLLWISGGVLTKEMQSAISKSFPGTKVYQAYGSSELNGVAFKQAPGFKLGSCGTIVQNMSMKVIESVTGRILGPNEPGEACFKSKFAMTHYLGNPDATRTAVDSEGWLHSGDLVYYDEEGNIFITDRICEMIRYRGYCISPESIEQAMQSHPAIFDVAVVGVPDNGDDEHPIAFVSKSPGFEVTEEELEKLMANSLPDHKFIRYNVNFLDQVPRLPSGKIARADLKNLAKSYEQGRVDKKCFPDATTMVQSVSTSAVQLLC